jgi:two-component system, LytTR family, sensor kinase
MIKKSQRALFYIVFSAVFYLIWLVFYYNANGNLIWSLIYSLVDMILFAGVYWIVSYRLIPKYLMNRCFKPYIVYFILLVFLVTALRISSFALVHIVSGSTLKVNFFVVQYVFATTTLVLLAISGIRFTINWLQNQQKIEEVQKEKVASELAFLKGQLNPHFFFNSINTLYGSIDQSNETARQVLIKIADMLRYQLYECGAEKVKMEQELTYINNYVELQKMRQQHGLIVNINNDNHLGKELIPPLLLAPLVENAFKYVSHYTDKENWVDISVLKVQEGIHLKIENSFDVNAKEETVVSASGIGLSNIRKRLNLMYNNQHNLQIEKDQGVFRVNLILKEV